VITSEIDTAINILHQGGVIAYPTEAVFGLGCNPFNQAAVEKIYQIKQRDRKKALLLIASSFDQVTLLCDKIPTEKLETVQKSWPGPTTWIFPASKKAPLWILGNEKGIAIRITNHPIAKALCEQFKGPIISTSANPEGKPPAKTAKQVQVYFENQLDLILDGPLGNLENPTTIRDALTGKTIRN
jgi:L-threonylcarbamoyladenylate synthase